MTCTNVKLALLRDNTLLLQFKSNPIIFIYPNVNDNNICNVRFDSTKGFGFIVPDDDSGDVFVHQTSIKVDGFRSLDENQRVEFRVETDKNGKTKAMDVVSEA